MRLPLSVIKLVWPATLPSVYGRSQANYIYGQSFPQSPMYCDNISSAFTQTTIRQYLDIHKRNTMGGGEIGEWMLTYYLEVVGGEPALGIDQSVRLT